MTIRFDNSFAKLSDTMFTRLPPTPVADPKLIAYNEALGRELGIDVDDRAAVFAGNKISEGAAPLAQLYAGHQFGNWNPQLGDGRAILLGEVLDCHQQRRDIQLKGSGRTPYSRGGDGRAWLGPVLREYVVSEAMHAMGVPTTRALAAVSTGEDVIRETRLPGAILTRVAASHIRAGTFQIYAARGMIEELKALTDYTIARHYPDADGPQALLDAVIARQAHLIAKWMSLGFIHGVMNTDNASIAGETIDYGPCAFMDTYHPHTVFSSIDQTGRYAYANQPRIAAWNMAQLATALIPLMPDQDAAIESFTASVNALPVLYENEWRQIFGAKLGLAEATKEDDALITGFLGLLQTQALDFTNSFRALSGDKPRDHFTDTDAFEHWATLWQSRDPQTALMDQSNPQIIPRNHQVEAMIQAAVKDDFKPFNALLDAVTQPFAPVTANTKHFTTPPAANEAVRQTFCGT